MLVPLLFKVEPLPSDQLLIRVMRRELSPQRGGQRRPPDSSHQRLKRPAANERVRGSAGINSAIVCRCTVVEASGLLRYSQCHCRWETHTPSGLGPNLDGEQSPLIRYLGEEGNQSAHKVEETDAGEEVLDEEPCTVPEGYVIPLPDATVQQQRSEGDVGQCHDAAVSSVEEAGQCLSPDGPTCGVQLPEDSARRTVASPPLSGQSDEDAPSSTAQHAAAQRWSSEAPRTSVDEQSEQPPEGLNLEDMNALLGSAVERLSTNYQQLQDPDSELSTRYPALHALLEAAAAASSGDSGHHQDTQRNSQSD
ncbi:hypothetical protein FOZ63_026094 [Perkinsus olseni]|uniref:Uncharacterized protein n=1 Tax=Perkinsus olseni TaxID=32597 RepID=A0A7J6UMU0_PEROL|nr:hypothetical protein FOZ63_026094 [Perkinsus olseni]